MMSESEDLIQDIQTESTAASSRHKTIIALFLVLLLLEVSELVLDFIRYHYIPLPAVIVYLVVLAIPATAFVLLYRRLRAGWLISVFVLGLFGAATTIGVLKRVLLKRPVIMLTLPDLRLILIAALEMTIFALLTMPVERNYYSIKKETGNLAAVSSVALGVILGLLLN